MVTKETTIRNLTIYYRLGTILIWLGVLAWAPFIILRAMGEKPAFLWFLPFHLVGVLGGSRLRSTARKEMGAGQTKKNMLRRMGHGLIFLGILVWLPYFYMKVILAQPVEAMDFLPFHLSGILGGVALHVLSYVIGRFSAEGN